MTGPNQHRLGPHRDPAVDTAVLDAARGLLVERGYAGTSIDAIAARAGVSRTAIYRRWPSKAHVVATAVFPDAAGGEPAADLRTEIHTVVRDTIRLFGSAEARAAIPGLMADMRADSGLYERLTTVLDAPARRHFAALLAAEGGAPRPGRDPDILLDAIGGAALFAMCIRDIDDPDGFATALENLLLYGILGSPKSDD
ncbi:TetR/AcrR family transcriptional regulator [Nocardia stercoris]|uniref:TetR/AcrR family transcriptional regulator n=1 Tax=Nocardia stercoris TaxID=2483361 RepID=A0A3M2KYK4_9NOCA|nr:TetR/AcrR family transcriptional regulator [Nocardia stercoris]RMI30361.1 TetR/AcrR family transcriptional regulator [Nocardia stercoris]